MEYTFTVDSVKTDRFEMDYLKFGEGKNVMVVLPGVSITKVTQAAPAIVRQFEAFIPEFTVYLFDRKNDMEKGYMVSNMADDTVSAMQSLGISEACFYGASQGGMIIQQIMIRHPGVVRRAVIVSSSCRMNSLSCVVFDAWVGTAKRKDLQALNVSFAKYLYTPETLKRLGDGIRFLNRHATEEDLDRFVLQMEANENTDGKLGGVNCPVLVIGGEDDIIFGPEESEYLAEQFGCDVVLYRGYGHAVYDECPDVLVKTFQFLTGNYKSPGRKLVI